MDITLDEFGTETLTRVAEAMSTLTLPTYSTLPTSCGAACHKKTIAQARQGGKRSGNGSHGLTL